jgi:hypothetical protein
LRVYLERGRRSSLAAIVEDALAMVVSSVRLFD